MTVSSDDGGAVVPVPAGLAAGAALLVGLLSALTAGVGLGPAGWAAGLLCGLVTHAVLARTAVALGPADLVTGTRLVLTCAAAALVADSLLTRPAVPVLVATAAAALALDAVDGPVARRTRTQSAFGARFDGEADAFLMLVLSVYVADGFGAWVLAIGGARYAFAVAGWGLPWLRVQLPPRYWRKVVAATQGVALVVAAADVVPHAAATAALAGALAMLAESFGRDVLWSWRHRTAAATPSPRRTRSVPVPRR